MFTIWFYLWKESNCNVIPVERHDHYRWCNLHSERLTAAHIQEAVKAYIRAVDTNTLITKIDKIKPTLNHEEVEIDEDVLTRQKIENYDGIRILKSAPTRSTRSMWWFLEER